MRTGGLAVLAALATACSTTNPCQTALTPLDYGDCSDLADAGVPFGPTSRTTCQDNCTSFSDQATITNIFACLNTIPPDAGACSMANETAWAEEVTGQAALCVTNATELSTPCLTAFFPDAG